MREIRVATVPRVESMRDEDGRSTIMVYKYQKTDVG